MKKSILGAVGRLSREVKQYKKDAFLSPMYTTLCVILEIYIPYLTASIIDGGIAVNDMGHVVRIGLLMMAMALLAALSLAIGNVVAIAQTNLKRMLAYSTVSHVGFLFLGKLTGIREGTILTALLVGKTMAFFRKLLAPRIQKLCF